MKEDWFNLRTAREAFMLGKHAAQERIVRDNLRKVAGMDPEDEMNIDVGRKTIIHEANRSSTNWPALLATALGSGGLAAAAATWWALGGQPTQTPQPDPTPAVDYQDTNTQYDFGLGDPPQ